jgi:predicted transcriptional regulator
MAQKPQTPDGRKTTVRLSPDLAKRVDAMVFVTGRSYQDLAETAVAEYFDRLKLTPDQQKKLKVMLG